MATIPFVMVIALVLAVGMVCLLVLTTALQDQTFVVQSRQREAERLSDQLAALQAEIADARSVTHLAVAAQELGMRPNPYGAQLQLPDGTVVGTATAVTGGEIPGLRYLTPEQAEAQLQALAKAEAERTAKLKAEAKAKAEAKKQAEAKKKAEAKAKAEAEAKAKAEAEKKAKAKAEAEKKAKAEAEAKDKKKGKRP
jgi:colicin import membrane protein